MHEPVTLSKDIIINSLVAPEDVTVGSAFAASFSATTQDSETVEWATSGDYNIAHFKGMSGAALSGNGGKVVKVNSGATGFELSAAGVFTNNLAAITAPTASDDSGSGYSVGSIWIDTTNDKSYTCVDATASAAVWKETSPTVPTHTHSIDDLTDVDVTTAAPTSGQILAWDGSNFTPSTNTTQNLWATVTGDSGTTTASSTTSSIQIAGGDGLDTSVSGDVVTISGEDASATNKGIASFDTASFTVSGGGVTLKNVSIANGGTGSANAEDAFDSLSPLSTQGDLLTYGVSDNIRLALGTAGDSLAVNSAADEVIWRKNNLAATTAPVATDDSASSYEVGSRWIDTTADKEYVCLDATASTAVWTETTGGGGGGGTTYTAGDGLDLSGGNEFSADLKSAGGLKIDSTELALDVDGLADLTNTTFGTANFGAGDHIAVADASDSNAPKKVKFPVELIMAASDETTDLITRDAALTFRMPYAMTLTEVRASVNTAPVGSTIIVDIRESATTIFSTKLSIDASEKTSTTAATPAVISDGAIADDAEMKIDIDQIGSSTSGSGLKLVFIGYR